MVLKGDGEKLDFNSLKSMASFHFGACVSNNEGPATQESRWGSARSAGNAKEWRGVEREGRVNHETRNTMSRELINNPGLAGSSRWPEQYNQENSMRDSEEGKQ